MTNAERLLLALTGFGIAARIGIVFLGTVPTEETPIPTKETPTIAAPMISGAVTGTYTFAGSGYVTVIGHRAAQKIEAGHDNVFLQFPEK